MDATDFALLSAKLLDISPSVISNSNMKRKSRTEFAILGMLTQRPMSGYDLKLQFEERIAHFWSESIGQIYPALARLSEAGLISGKEKTRPNRPRRTEYRITAKGRTRLEAWLHEPVGKEQVRNELLLKMFFGPASDLETSLGHLGAFEAIQKSMQNQFEHYSERIDDEEASDLQKTYWRLTLLSGQMVNEARLNWCRKAKEMLSSHAEQTRKKSAK